MRTSRVLMAAGLSLVFAACGGGGGGSPSAPAGSRPVTNNAGQLPITVYVPQKSAQGKRPQFVSPNTQSLAVYVWQGSTQPATPTATINISGCPNTNGTLTCTATVAAPLATLNVRVDALAGQNGTGSVLATATTSVTVSVGMSPVQITLAGNPSLIKYTIETPALLSGTAGTSKLDINAYDASGALIVAPGTFSSPITVTSDSTAVSLSATTATSPGTQLTITYSGGAAPYAIHFGGSGASVAPSSIVGATLDVIPATSLAFISETYGTHIWAVTVVGSNATNEPPQNQFYLTPVSNLVYFSPGSFAYLANGTVVTTIYDNTSMCTMRVYPASNPQAPQDLVYHVPTDSPVYCTVVAEPNGNVLASDGNSTDDITEYSIAANGTPTATGRTISLLGPQVPSGSVGVEAMAMNASGQLGILAYTGSAYYAMTYAANASGAATPLQTISLSTPPRTIGIASDGTVAVGYQINSPSFLYKVDRYNLAGSLAGSITPATSFTYDYLNGLTFDANNNLYVAADQSSSGSPQNYGQTIDMYPPNTFGTVAPTLSIPLAQAAGSATVVDGGPVIVPSPAPAATPPPVSGDMLGYAPSRTWTYLVTPPDPSNAPYYFGIYADPNLVNGNIRLVGYQSASANPFSGGTLVGSADFTNVNGSYFAVGYASVSSGSLGTSGTIPGSPLFVPNSLSMNSTWTPLQNQGIATLTGVNTNAQVVGGGAVNGIAACPAGSSPAGATVQYSISQTMFNYGEAVRISFVPGCGMVNLLVSDGGTAVLQSVGTMPSLGQQSAPAGQPAIVQALHALWRSTFHVKPPH